MTPVARRSKRTSFPIFTSRRCFDQKALPRLKHLAPEHLAFIKGVQPYHRPDPDHDMLALLSRLSNADKHRIILPIAAKREFEAVSTSSATINFAHVHEGALEDGTQIVRFTATPTSPGTEMHVEPHASIQISLDGDPMYPVPVILVGLHNHVRYYVIERYLTGG